MSASPQAIPAQLELSDRETEHEDAALEAAASAGLVARILGVVKSPIGMGVCGLLVLLIIAGALLGSGVLQVFGKAPSVETDVLASESEMVSEALVEQPELESEADAVETVEVEAPEDKFASEYGSITFSNDGAVYHTVPTTVQLQANGGRAQLTLSVGIVTDAASAQSLLDNGLSVNLIKIEAAETLDLGPYLDWQIPGLVTKDIKRRLEIAYPELNIRGIMIRDFRIT